MSKSKEEKYKSKQKDYLNWLIKEYDCYSLEELIELSKTDTDLNRIIRECGINLRE